MEETDWLQAGVRAHSPPLRDTQRKAVMLPPALGEGDKGFNMWALGEGDKGFNVWARTGQDVILIKGKL